jgi:hypothetical protein
MERFTKYIKYTLGNNTKEVKRNLDRYRETEQSDSLNKCKEIICDLLKIIFDIRNDLRVTMFMSEFRKEIDSHNEKSPDSNQMLPLEHSRSKSGGFDEMASLVPAKPE